MNLLHKEQRFPHFWGVMVLSKFGILGGIFSISRPAIRSKSEANKDFVEDRPVLSKQLQLFMGRNIETYQTQSEL